MIWIRCSICSSISIFNMYFRFEISI